MKILVAGAAHAYSFVNQAQDLVKGLAENKVFADLALVRKAEDLQKAVDNIKPEVVISVANWVNYELMVGSIKAKKVKIYPWIVSDELKINQYIEEFNENKIVVTASEHCKENLARSGINSKIIKVIPLAVDPNIWYRESEVELKNSIRTLTIPNPNQEEIKFDIAMLRSKEIPVLYTTGGDPTKKGVQEVMRALAKLDKDIPWVYLVKSWPTTAVFEKGIEELSLAQDLGIWPRVRYLVGQFSQDFMRDLTNLCDIYAAPSRNEGFGLPLVEASLCEKAVITHDATAAGEKVEDGETGFVVKARKEGAGFEANILDLAEKLQELLLNKKRREEMGRKGRQRSIELYSPKIVGRQFLDLIYS
jgi:glycosyltransferase involved in cell wall biosynthesis